MDRLALSESHVLPVWQRVDTVDCSGKTRLVKFSSSIRPGNRDLQRRVPIGVIGIIYESRPNVTADALAYALQICTVIFRATQRCHPFNMTITKVLRKSHCSRGRMRGCYFAGGRYKS